MQGVVAEGGELSRQPARKLRVHDELHAPTGSTRLRRLSFATQAYTATEKDPRGWGLAGYSTVTLLARLRGLSTSQPRATAMW